MPIRIINPVRFKWPAVVFLTLLILYLLACTVSYFFGREEIRIGYGPYYTYTPVNLKMQNQEKFNRANWELSHFFEPWKKSFVIQALVDTKGDYEDIIRKSIFYDLSNGESGNQMTSANTYVWLCTQNDFTGKNSLEVIGYKTSEKDYYNSRFIWHKGIGDLSADKNQTIGQILSRIPGVRILLNERTMSGSTYIVPKIYLIENFPNRALNVSYESKSNVVKETIFKRQAIGTISNSEFTGQLDRGMRDSLFAQDIMVNIPHDAIVVNKRWWNSTIMKEHQKEILTVLTKHNIITPNSRSKIFRDMHSFDREFELRKEKKREVLASMFKYYVSMGIWVKPDSVYVPDNNLMNLKFRKDFTQYVVYRTVYGDVQNPYFTFEKVRGNIRINDYYRAKFDSLGGQRLRVLSQSKAAELDDLLRVRDSLFIRKYK